MGKTKMVSMENYAKKFERHDLDRLGLFIEMPYECSGLKGLKKKKPPPKLPPEHLGTMLAGYPKTKCGNQDGYFAEEFVRTFVGEYGRKKKKKGPPGKPIIPFMPAGPGKKHATPGDYFGCFLVDDEWPERFSPAERGAQRGIKKKVTKFERPNIITNPAKKGGCGYVDICLNEYPEHSEEPPPPALKKKTSKVPDKPPFYPLTYPREFDKNPYVDPKNDPPTKPLYLKPKPVKVKDKKLLRMLGRKPFTPAGPGKLQGGFHDGCFDPFPKHEKEPFLSPMQIEKYEPPPKRGKPQPVPLWKFKEKFRPPNTAYVTMFDRAILTNTTYQVNESNWRTYQPHYVEYL